MIPFAGKELTVGDKQLLTRLRKEAATEAAPAPKTESSVLRDRINRLLGQLPPRRRVLLIETLLHAARAQVRQGEANAES